MGGWATEACVDEGDARGERAHDEMRRILDPEDGVTIEQHVANRSATDRRDNGDDEHTQYVHPTPARGERATRREDCRAEKLEHGDHVGDLTTNRAAPGRLGRCRFAAVFLL